jgi:hypothetical protein
MSRPLSGQRLIEERGDTRSMGVMGRPRRHAWHGSQVPGDGCGSTGRALTSSGEPRHGRAVRGSITGSVRTAAMGSQEIGSG